MLTQRYWNLLFSGKSGLFGPLPASHKFQFDFVAVSMRICSLVWSELLGPRAGN